MELGLGDPGRGVGRPVKIISWNVNGLRAAYRKGFAGFLDECEADVVCVQEVRASREQLESELARTRGWFVHLVAAQRKGYSGVGVFSRTDPSRVETSLGVSRFDTEGRFQLFYFGEWFIVNVYFFNGNGLVLLNGKWSNDRVFYKLDFYWVLFDCLEDVRVVG